MLPEGGHNRVTDTTYFILNRKKGKDLLNDIQRLQTDGVSHYLGQRYFTSERIQLLRALHSKGPKLISSTENGDISIKLH